jgi:HEAT repeat protein
MVDGTILIWDSPLAARSAKDLDKKALAPLWTDLAGEAPKAYRAVWTLADSPNQAMPFLNQHLKPAEEVDPKQVQRLLADLDSEEFTTREKAAKELAKLGERIEPALRKALEGQPSEEVRRQIKAILDAPRAVPSGETLRTMRAIQVLERIGTPEARDVLKKLAAGAAAARETREAQESLERLARKAK